MAESKLTYHAQAGSMTYEELLEGYKKQEVLINEMQFQIDQMKRLLFFGTCKKNNVNPFQWLKKILEVSPDYKVNSLHELLPQNLTL